MKYFFDTVMHWHIARQGYRSFLEIGASYGENTDRLLEVPRVGITIIDPCLDTDLEAKYAGNAKVQVCKGLSLDMLPKISTTFDCIFIDGDHNWYTVINELALISRRGLLAPGGTIFLHDVGWPYGRRDMYYQPEAIPAEFVHPHARRGIVVGQTLLADGPGNNDARENALYSGGPRNGVLTAVEDFAAENRKGYWLATVDEQHGLGILFRRKTLKDDGAFLLLWSKINARNFKRRFGPRKKALVITALLAVAIVCLRLLAGSEQRR